MDISIVDNLLWGVLVVQFALLSIVGAASVFHTILMDQKLRLFAKIQVETIEGLKEGFEAVKSNREESRRARMQSVFEE